MTTKTINAGEYFSMSRRKRVRMRFIDFYVLNGQPVVRAQIRWGEMMWDKSYGIGGDKPQEISLEFIKTFLTKQAKALIADAETSKKVFADLEDFKGQEMFLD